MKLEQALTWADGKTLANGERNTEALKTLAKEVRRLTQIADAAEEFLTFGGGLRRDKLERLLKNGKLS